MAASGDLKNEVINLISDMDQDLDDEDQQKSYLEIDDLQLQKVSIADVKKLKESGFYTVESIAYAPRFKLTAIRGISDAKVGALQDAAFKLLSNDMSFQTATEYYRKRANVIKITTGSTKLDELLGGGIETGSITEIFGESATGKTQICHMLCVTTQFPTASGGGEGCVLYIDVEDTFRPKRVEQMAARYGMDSKDLLDNITFIRAYSSDHLSRVLQETKKMMTTSHYAMVIVDGAVTMMEREYSGRFMEDQRRQKLGEFMQRLHELCDIHGVAVVVTNQMERNWMSFGPSRLPLCDNEMAHASTTRIWLRKGSKNQRVARIYNSPNLPVDEINFNITNEGISDE